MAQTLFLDMAARARAVLGTSRIFDLRSLDVDQDGDCVVLRGSVSSFYHKQLAQELLKTRIAGIEVINEIDVDYSVAGTLRVPSASGIEVVNEIDVDYRPRRGSDESWQYS